MNFSFRICFRFSIRNSALSVFGVATRNRTLGLRRAFSRASPRPIQDFHFRRISVSIPSYMNSSCRAIIALLPLALLGSLCAQEVQERFRPAMQEASEARTLEPNL